MYSVKELLNRNPIQISGAIGAGTNFAILMGWLDMTGDQVAGLNVFLLALLGLFVVTKTTNTAKLQELAPVRIDHEAGAASFREILVIIALILACIVMASWLGWVNV